MPTRKGLDLEIFLGPSKKGYQNKYLVYPAELALKNPSTT